MKKIISSIMYLEAGRTYIPGSEDWSDEQVNKASSSIPILQRMGYPEDIAVVVAFLVSKETITISGVQLFEGLDYEWQHG